MIFHMIFGNGSVSSRDHLLVRSCEDDWWHWITFKTIPTTTLEQNSEQQRSTLPITTLAVKRELAGASYCRVVSGLTASPTLRLVVWRGRGNYTERTEGWPYRRGAEI
ncbi:hypothetical protein J6590_077634 [Homalodisca vitripennis]|nr:hypothetical protein J6590_077634 [Homalodisca vitripennis]